MTARIEIEFGRRLPATEAPVWMDGEQIGVVRSCPTTQRYHAILEPMRAHTGSWSSVLVQGFGDTPEAAVADAIRQGSQHAREFLARITAIAQAYVENAPQPRRAYA